MDTRNVAHFGPIFLSGLPCKHDDTRIYDCYDDDNNEVAYYVGITNCDHFRDIYVRCEGNNIELNI